MKTKKTETAPKRGRGRPKKNATDKPKPKMGRPSKLTEAVQQKAKTLYLNGFTDAQVAEILDVTEQTVNNWKKADQNFFESLKDWKDEADGMVEKSLYQRACGYDKDDRHYPADATSIIFWLKNRQPGKWRDKHDQELTINGIEAILQSIHNG